jgi:4-coumarate--CoA ligase
LQIAPAELEGLLSAHPAVADVAVVGIASPNTEEGEIPRAFVVARPGHVISASDLVTFIDERVAAYKRLRGGVTFVSEIPRNASGKILRRVLRDSVAKGPAATAAMAPGGGVCSGSEKRSKL